MDISLAPPNIVITGSWRSGTTLLYLYFPIAFADVAISGVESPAMTTRLPAGFSWRVSKSPNDIHHAREIQIALDAWIIYMLRDPRDCIVSWKTARHDYHLAFNEWLRNFLFAKSYKGDKLLWIRFEQLVRRPEAVQELLAEIIGLRPVIPLAECHRHFVPHGEMIYRQLAHGVRDESPGPTVRPLDPLVIGSWRRDKARVRQQLDQFPEMQAILEWLGYEENEAWQHQLT